MHHSFAGSGTSSWRRHDSIPKLLAETSIGVMCGDRARKSAEEKIDATCLAVAVVTVAVSAVVSQRLPEAPIGSQS